MPRTKAAYQQIRTARRGQILEAAVHVFAHKGFADSTITDIAAAGHVSQGLIYRHFPSKEDLFTVLVEQATAYATRLAQAALEYAGTPWERLRWMTFQMLPEQQVDVRSDYSLVMVYALTNEAVPAHVRERAAEQGEVVYNAIRRLIRDGQAVGQVIEGDPDQLTTLYLACIQGLGLRATFPRRAEIPATPDAESVLLILQAHR